MSGNPNLQSRALRRKLAWVAGFYFAEGLPFGLMIDNLPVYFRVHGVSLAEIGLLSLLGLPWTLKVLWAPLVDRIGERRHWITAALVTMAVALLVLPALDPREPTWMLWALLLLFTTASATQDIAIDAWTIGVVAPGEEGLANGIRVSAYRAALIVAGGGLVIVAGTMGWVFVFHGAAGIFLMLAVAAWRSPRVAAPRRPAPGEHFFAPLLAWIRRPGALAVLFFVLLYKLGDAAMGPMVKPFWLDRGLSVEEIGLVSTSFGVAASVLGALVGGWVTSRYGIFRALIFLGALQALSNLGYATVAFTDAGRLSIYAASLLESFTGGLGTAAFLAFLMHICDPEQAATEYALLSALFGLTRTLAGAVSGIAATTLGYGAFFAMTFVLAFPAYALLPRIRTWIHDGRD
ncbi:MAG: MFS transporter [Deltaproteobacteria bacterium]